jgi:hypothetical protein
MTREEILAVYAQGPEAVVTLVTMLLERLAHLEARVATLEAQLAKDSHNSGKPPSSDVTRDPVRRPRSLRGQSGKRPGGQPGCQSTFEIGSGTELVDDASSTTRPPMPCLTRRGARARGAAGSLPAHTSSA